MSEPKHTPGPWEYGEAANYCGYYVAPRGTRPTLASVERPRGNTETCNVNVHNFPGQTEANARLIAAAPDLLEVCRYIDSDQSGVGMSREAWAMLRAAIAKATNAEETKR